MRAAAGPPASPTGLSGLPAGVSEAVRSRGVAVGECLSYRPGPRGQGSYRALTADGRDAVLTLRQDRGAQTRLRAGTLASLRHPGLPPVLAVLTLPHGWTGLLAGLVDGVELTDVLERMPYLTRAETAQVVADVGCALAALHAAGLTHGDISPDNVLVTAEGRAVLIDLLDTDDATGTPPWAAPEQVRDGQQPPGPAADVYSLARLAVSCVEGSEPLRREIDAVLAPALARDPDQRPRLTTLMTSLAELDGTRPLELDQALRAGCCDLRRHARTPTRREAGTDCVPPAGDDDGQCEPGAGRPVSSRGEVADPADTHSPTHRAGRVRRGRRGRARGGRPGRARRAPRGLHVPGGGLIAVLLAMIIGVGAGWWVLERPDTSTVAPTGAVRATDEAPATATLGLPPHAAATCSSDATGGPSEPADGCAAHQAAAGPSTLPTDAADRDADEETVAALLELTRQRDQALMALDDQALAAVSVTGSAAAQADARVLQALRDAGERVEGLRTQIVSATVVRREQATGRVRVVVRRRQLAHIRVRQDGSRRYVPDQDERRVVVVLVPDPWRVESVEEATDAGVDASQVVPDASEAPDTAHAPDTAGSAQR